MASHDYIAETIGDFISDINVLGFFKSLLVCPFASFNSSVLVRKLTHQLNILYFSPKIMVWVILRKEEISYYTTEFLKTLWPLICDSEPSFKKHTKRNLFLFAAAINIFVPSFQFGALFLTTFKLIPLTLMKILCSWLVVSFYFFFCIPWLFLLSYIQFILKL